MRVAIILCSLVFASAAFVGQPAQAQVLDDGSIQGRICIVAPWGECTEPLPGATVRAVGAAILGLAAVDKTATSQEDGSYRIDGLRDGDYDVTVSHAGFVTQTLRLTVDGQEIQDFTLQGEMVDLTGRVEDAEGAPVASAYVRMWGYSGGFEAKTAADGSFSAKLAAGWYDVTVETLNHRFLQERRLIDGEELVLAFQPLPGQEARLEGRVVDQHGDPVQGAAVIVHQWEARRADGSFEYGDFRNSTLTGSDGRYAIALYGGDVSVQVRKDGHATAHDWFRINATETIGRDFAVVKYPPKTARLLGSVTNAAGEPLPFVRISIELPEYGLHECSQANRTAGSSRGAAEPAYADAAVDVAYPYEYRPAPCAIELAGGTFSGNVTPGYAILRVWFDRWAACDETYHGDGSYERKCGPDYFPYTQTLTLPADEETRLDIELRQRPGADAAVSGYAVDSESGKAISGAWFSFQHQDAYGWGSASTDADGSYKVRLRSGYQQVEVWAEGYLPWQGVLDVPAGKEIPFDVVLTAGQARYGGCCYDAVYAHADGEAASTRGSGSAPAKGSSSVGEGAEYEDMGGGLGPYDAEQRAKLFTQDTEKKDRGIPSPLAWAVLGLAAVAVIRRR